MVVKNLFNKIKVPVEKFEQVNRQLDEMLNHLSAILFDKAATNTIELERVISIRVEVINKLIIINDSLKCVHICST